MRFFVFLILLTSAVFCDTVLISDYKALQSFATKHYLAVALQELNRSLAEVRLHHPSYVPDQKSVEKIVTELRDKGYFDPQIFYDFSHNPVEITSSGFISTHHPKLKFSDFPLPARISPKLLKTAVMDRDHPYARLLALEMMGKIPKKPLPILPLIHGLHKENDPFFLARFARILKKPLWYAILQKQHLKISTGFSKALKSLYKRAKNRHEKAVIFFFSLVFTKTKPEPEIPVLMTLIDEHYPIDFLVKTFKGYTADSIETFAEPFQKGYGKEFKTLLTLFSHFPKNRIIMKALYQGLIHRNDGHFQLIEGQLIQVWAKLTKTPWKGSDQPYRDWYLSRFK
jgi:hypothetical protein